MHSQTLKKDGPDLECWGSLRLFWNLFKEQRNKDTVTATSSMGVKRPFTKRSIASFLAGALVEAAKDSGDSSIAAVHVSPGPSAVLLITLRVRVEAEAKAGRISCTDCGKFVRAANDGLQWHMKTAHGKTDHGKACDAARAQKLALIPRIPAVHSFMQVGSNTFSARLNPADIAKAQSGPASAARLVAEGRIRDLGEGLNQCRSGDLETLRRIVDEGLFNPITARDPNGSGSLLWAAGGGHLHVCRYLVESCGVDPATTADSSGARRGYKGRSALHWASRNGHLDVVE